MDILLVGSGGRMGKNIARLIKNNPNAKITAGVIRIAAGVSAEDVLDNTDFPVYKNISDVKENIDVIIDFSSPDLIGDILEYASKNATPIVIGTTGFSKDALALIENSKSTLPIFKSGNMSIGINVIAELAAKAAVLLGDDFDIEITERHHREKKDSPSGTALLLADEINSARENKYEYCYDRTTRSTRRPANEIGISAIRGGTIPGDHTILFAGHDENIEISHSALSREIFAKGAIRAAIFMADKKPGMYNMKTLVKELT